LGEFWGHCANGSRIQGRKKETKDDEATGRLIYFSRGSMIKKRNHSESDRELSARHPLLMALRENEREGCALAR
jgi:hypothetical protein